MTTARRSRRGARPTRSLTAAVVASALALVCTGCAGGGSAKLDPQALLTGSKAKVDSTSSLHFSLTSSGVGNQGTKITGGNGDLARPDAMSGTFTVNVKGFPADVKVVSKGGVFEAQLPFMSGYVRTDPANFGLKNPAELMDRQTGVTNLLSLAENPQAGPQVRIAGELLDTVTSTVPGNDVPVLPDVAPDRPVTMVVAINPKTLELRQVSLTGPFVTAASDSTYVLLLTSYGAQVDITLPSAS